ncbi:MAG: methyltransferase domain-containing protein [Desulfatiglandales bacterium]
MTKKRLFTSHIYDDWMGTLQRYKIEQILSKVKIEKNARVLDLGSGAGFFNDSLNNVVAVDVDEISLKKNRSTKVLGSGDAIPFKNSVFDVVFCLDTVHLLSGITDLTRVLHEGGMVVASRFCNEYNKVERLEELKKIFTEWDIVDEFFVGKSELELDAVLYLIKRD